MRHLNLVYELPVYASLQDWKRRAAELRLHILVACGLYPLPERCLLKPRRSVCYEEADYLIERVAWESLPGYFVTGNLFRPKGQQPPYPAMLHPHGHFEQGRLNEADLLRSVALARAGFVVLSYDMVGYNDHFQLVHRGQESAQEHLWGFSRAGLQLWNSLRAVDWLCSMPEVDKKRIGCSGISGGGTQTFLLAAVDTRVRLAVPVKMVSAHMQGGCLCENPPSLRVETTNPELTALIAPRPLLLISDSGDWTDDNPSTVFPFLRSIYRLFRAEERVANAHFSEGHQFGKAARQAYYDWLQHWFTPKSPLGTFLEPDSPPEPERLRVWGDALPKPKGVPEGEQLRRLFISEVQRQIVSLSRFRSRSDLRSFQHTMRPALQHALNVSLQGRGNEQVTPVPSPLSLTTSSPSKSSSRGRKSQAVLLVASEGSPLRETLCRALSERGLTVVAAQGVPSPASPPDEVQFFTTYNRTETAERVGAILAVLLALQSRFSQVHLIGLGTQGLEALLARALWGGCGRTLVDTARFDPDSDQAFTQHLYTPCLRRVGDLRTAGLLVAPQPLWLFNLHPHFPTQALQVAYRLMQAEQALRLDSAQPSSEAMLAWCTGSSP